MGKILWILKGMVNRWTTEIKALRLGEHSQLSHSLVLLQFCENRLFYSLLWPEQPGQSVASRMHSVTIAEIMHLLRWSPGIRRNWNQDFQVKVNQSSLQACAPHPSSQRSHSNDPLNKNCNFPMRSGCFRHSIQWEVTSSQSETFRAVRSLSGHLTSPFRGEDAAGAWGASS